MADKFFTSRHVQSDGKRWAIVKTNQLPVAEAEYFCAIANAAEEIRRRFVSALGMIQSLPHYPSDRARLLWIQEQNEWLDALAGEPQRGEIETCQSNE